MPSPSSSGLGYLSSFPTVNVPCAIFPKAKQMDSPLLINMYSVLARIPVVCEHALTAQILRTYSQHISYILTNHTRYFDPLASVPAPAIWQPQPKAALLQRLSKTNLNLQRPCGDDYEQKTRISL